MIQVQFETTPADIQALQAFALSSVEGFANKAALGFSWRSMLMGVPFGLALFVGLKFLDVSFHMPTALLAAGIFILYYVFVRRQLAGVSSPAVDGAQLGYRRTSIGEDGVREESRNHKSHSAWRGILSVGETPSHVFLMVDRFAGYIVPKRAFESSAHLEEFVTFTRAHAGGSHRPTPTVPSLN